MQRTLTIAAGAALAAACGSKAPATGTMISNHADPRPLDTSIRKVDFLNRTYDEATVTNGEFERPHDEDGDPMGFFHVEAPAYGDVDGDGVEDAVVITIDNSGGTGMFDAAHVFTLRGGKVVEIGAIGGGDRGDGGLRSVEVVTGAVKVTRNLSLDGDGACCPSKLTIEQWRWTGAGLALDPRSVVTIANPDR